MKIAKSLLLALACVGLALSSQAQSPTYASQTLLSSYIVSGSTQSNSIGSLLDCRKQQNVAIQWTSIGNATNTNNITFSASVDGVNWKTNLYNFTTKDAATTVLLTNLTVAGFGYLRLENFTNSVSSPSTNTIVYSVKISSP